MIEPLIEPLTASLIEPLAELGEPVEPLPSDSTGEISTDLTTDDLNDSIVETANGINQTIDETNKIIEPVEEYSAIDSHVTEETIEQHTDEFTTADNTDNDEPDLKDSELVNDREMPLLDHLAELRTRIFYAIASVIVAIIGCFVFVNKIVYFLEIPAQGVKFLQLSPGEYFFVSIKVAGYSGLVLAAPMILYQIVRFVLPGLTPREQKFVAPIVFGSSILFIAGIAFAYIALIPAALNFFISYGANVVEQLWSIDLYFEFVLLLLFSTGLAFQIPIVQALLGLVGIVTSKQMLKGWRYVILGALVVGGVLTPSTDPLTQSLLAGAVGGLYFGGIGLVKLLGR